MVNEVVDVGKLLAGGVRLIKLTVWLRLCEFLFDVDAIAIPPFCSEIIVGILVDKLATF